MITTLLIYILLIFTNNLQILPQFLILVKPHHCIKELDRGVVSRITWYYSNGESVGLDSYNRLYLKTYILELFNMIIKLINLTIKWGVFSIIILLISSPLSSNKSKIRNIYKAITALNPKDICKTQIGVIDIETVVINGKLYPYAVGIAYLKDGNKVVKTFYINLSIRNGDQSTEYRSNEIFKLVCAFIKSNLTGYTLYAHNIGKFDGYFIIKPFLTYFGPYRLLVDKAHAIISMNLPGDIIIKDSYRILPESLKTLGILFETEHQKLEFDHTKVTVRKIRKGVFRAKLLSYLHNDVICLLEVIMKASEMMLHKFNVDIHDSYSTSSLAFRVFRTKYMMRNHIPVLPLWLDKIIRKSYRGGSVDVYKVISDQAYYYDVNSLYPHGMCNDIPYEYLGFKLKPNISKFFGFGFAIISVPKNVKIPLVPIQAEDGSLFYPTGYMRGLFFSEELKLFVKQGYNVKILYGYEFSKADIFSNYVKDLYELKATTTGPIQKLVKLLLNGLYGYFGRNPNTLTASFLTCDQSKLLMKTHRIYDILELDDNIILTISDTIPDKSLCNENGISYVKALKFSNYHNPVKTNVAICSAITSYSRIHMAQFKTMSDNDLLYSDTDSVFLTKPLDPKYVHPTTLGMMKDELKGEIIKQCLFLEPKLYYYKTDTLEVIKARGVKRGYMTIEMIHQLHLGETIHFKFNRLHKSFANITIKEKTVNYSLTRNFDRKEPIYNSKGLLIAYRPKHISFVKAIFNFKL